MARPTVHPTTEELYEQLLPLAKWSTDQVPDHDEANDWPFLRLVEALTKGYHQVDDVAREDDDYVGWGKLLDPDVAPAWALPWLAQFVGVVLPPRLTKVVDAVNLVTRPSFEDATLAPWVTSGGHFNTPATSIARVTADSYSGNAAARVVLPAVANAGVRYPFPDTFEGGVEYRATVMVRLFGGVSPDLALALGNATDQDYSAETRIFPGWAELTVAWTPTADRTGVELAVYSPDGDAADILIDDAGVGDGLVYFDGDSPGALWDGPPHASTSTLYRQESDEEYEARARQLIKETGGFLRGTPRAMRGVVEPTLTGAKRVRIVERPNGHAYRLLVLTAPSETPDEAATEAAAITQKPAGLVMTYIAAETPIIDEADADLTIDGVGAALAIDAVALADVNPDDD